MVKVTERVVYEVRSMLRFGLSPFTHKNFGIESIRNIFGCRFDRSSHHLVQTLHYVDNKPDWVLDDTPTYRFHQSYQPKNFLDVSGIPGTEVLPLFVYPWGTFSSGAITSDKSILSSRFLGPSRRETVEKEVTDLIRLRDAIRDYGFTPFSYPHSDINATVLRARCGTEVAVVMQGNHRTAALSYMGEKTLAIRPGSTCLKFVDENCVTEWPLVRAGLIDQSTAIKVLHWFF